MIEKIAQQLESLNKKLYLKMLALAVIVYFAFTRLLQDFLYRGKFDEIIADSFSGFTPSPEPYEIPLYVIGYAVIPILALIFYFSWRKFYRPWQLKYLVGLGVITVLAGIVGAVWKIDIPDFGSYLSYLETKGLGKAISLVLTKRIFALRFLTLFSLLTFGIIYLFWKESWPQKFFRFYDNQFLKSSAPVLLILLAFLIFHPNMPYEEHHYNYIVGTVNDVLGGKEFLHETTNQYGILPIYLLQTIFSQVNLSYEGLSFATFFFYFLFYLGIYFLIHKWLGSRVLAYLGTMIILAVTYFLQVSPTLSAYFYPGLTPFRYGFYLPVLIFVYYFFRDRKAWQRELAIILSALALFWNFDSGIYVFAATAFTFVYFELFEADHQLKQKVWRVVVLALRFAIYALGIFSVINLISFLSAGKWPSWSYYLDQVSQGVVANPLPMVGFFAVYVFVYLATILYLAYRKLQGQRNELVLVFLAIFGSLSFVYYVGNSAWNLLYPVSGPLVLIVLYFVSQQLNKRLGFSMFSGILIFAMLALIIKLPVEFGNRNYQALGQYAPETCCEAELKQDAQILREKYSYLEKIPLIHQRGTKLLIHTQKANALPIYELAQLHYKSRMDKVISDMGADPPEYLFIEKIKNDQIEYFESRVLGNYQKVESLNTLDVYQRKF